MRNNNNKLTNNTNAATTESLKQQLAYSSTDMLSYDELFSEMGDSIMKSYDKHGEIECKSKYNFHNIIKQIKQLNTDNITTDMRFEFRACDRLIFEIGTTMPSLELITEKSIHIEFDDLLIIDELIKKGDVTYQIRDYRDKCSDESSCPVSYIEKDIMINIYPKDDKLIIFAWYGQVGTSFDMNDIFDSEIFVVNHNDFLEFVKVAKNCIMSDAKIQNYLKHNFHNLPIEIKQVIHKMTNTFSSNVRKMTKTVSNELAGVNNSKPFFNVSVGPECLINIVHNRYDIYSSIVESSVIFFNADFNFQHSFFDLSMEEFFLVSKELKKDKQSSLILEEGTHIDLRVIDNILLIDVKKYDVNLLDSSPINTFNINISLDMFVNIYDTMYTTYKIEAKNRKNQQTALSEDIEESSLYSSEVYKFIDTFNFE